MNQPTSRSDEECERLAIENAQLRDAVTIWQKLADERKEQIAAQSERLVALSETREHEALIERVRFICVKGGVRPEIMGALCHAIRYDDTNAAPREITAEVSSPVLGEFGEVPQSEGTHTHPVPTREANAARGAAPVVTPSAGGLAIPPGFAIVPLEPTDEMLDAIENTAGATAAYRAMLLLALNAVPQVPPGENAVENPAETSKDSTGSATGVTGRRDALAYRVVVDKEGCAHCGGERMWTVEGPDEVCIGTSWGDEEVASDIADLMNMAFDAGKEPIHSASGERERVLAEAIDAVLRLTDQKVGLWGWQRAVTEAIRSLYQAPTDSPAKK